MLPPYILPCLLTLLFHIPLVLRSFLVTAFAVTLPIFAISAKPRVANFLDYKGLSAMDRLPSQLYMAVFYIFASFDLLILLFTGRMRPRRPRQWGIVYRWVEEVIMVRGIFGAHRSAPVLTRRW